MQREGNRRQQRAPIGTTRPRQHNNSSSCQKANRMISVTVKIPEDKLPMFYAAVARVLRASPSCSSAEYQTASGSSVSAATPARKRRERRRRCAERKIALLQEATTRLALRASDESQKETQRPDTKTLMTRLKYDHQRTVYKPAGPADNIALAPADLLENVPIETLWDKMQRMRQTGEYNALPVLEPSERAKRTGYYIQDREQELAPWSTTTSATSSELRSKKVTLSFTDVEPGPSRPSRPSRPAPKAPIMPAPRGSVSTKILQGAIREGKGPPDK